MNVPLNIDWQQILLHLLNFAILAFGLYLLLYKPVKNFMEKRIDYYKKMDEEAREKLTSAASLETERKTQLSEVDAEINRKKVVAAKETEELAAAAADKLIKEALQHE